MRAARHAWITPNRLTFVAAVLALAAAGAFALGGRMWFAVGALAYHLSFLIDCMDGKLARLTGKTSVLGQWLDFMLDRIVVTVAASALLVGEYARTDDPAYLTALGLVVFLNMFHQLNGQVMTQALQQAQSQLANGETSFSPVDRGIVSRLRQALAHRRIRADVFSAVEFQVAILIIAPITGAVLPITIIACVLLLAFDLAAIARFCLNAANIQRKLNERMNRHSIAPAQPRQPGLEFKNAGHHE